MKFEIYVSKKQKLQKSCLEVCKMETIEAKIYVSCKS